MRDTGTAGGGKRRWVSLSLSVLSLGLMCLSLYTWVSGSPDALRRDSLSLLALLALMLSAMPPDLGVLTWGRAVALWRVSDERRVVLAAGLQLFMLTFVLGAGLASLLDLLAPLSGFVYFIALGLLVLNGMLALLGLAQPGLPPSAAAR